MKCSLLACIGLLACAWPAMLAADTAAATNNNFPELEALGTPEASAQAPPTPAGSPASLAPDFLIALDMLFEGGTRRTAAAPNQGRIREVEFGYSAHIDPYFFGAVSFVLENEGGKMQVDLHEAYLRYAGLARGLVLRAGKIFLDCGIMNTIHQHDRPFSDSPLVQQDFFAYESAADFGIDAGWLLPFLPCYTKLGFGIFNGQVFGHAHGAGTPKPFPLLLGTLRSFFEIDDESGLRIGLNALVRPLAEGEPGKRAGYLGIDLLCKYLTLGPFRIAASGELWRRERTDNDQVTWGWYLLLDSRIGRSRTWALGTRYDWLKTVEPVPVRPETAWSLFLTLHPSEFSYQRLQYQYSDRLTQDAPEHLFTVQLSFILGAHPPHGF